MHRTVGILEFKEIMALEDCKAVPVYLHSVNPNIPTTNPSDAMRVTKCRYRKEFAVEKQRDRDSGAGGIGGRSADDERGAVPSGV